MQVSLFAPQTSNPSYGVVRALAKDSNDVSRANSSLTFVDSDGQVSMCLPISCSRQPPEGLQAALIDLAAAFRQIILLLHA